MAVSVKVKVLSFGFWVGMVIEKRVGDADFFLHFCNGMILTFAAPNRQHRRACFTRSRLAILTEISGGGAAR